MCPLIYRYYGRCLMLRLVMKFGGTSLADPEAMFRSAHHVRREQQKGHRILAVVVSAISGRTHSLRQSADHMQTLISKKHGSIPTKHWQSERDALLATGEQESAALMAMLLNGLSLRSMSFQGWQVPLHTDNNHGYAYPCDEPHAYTFSQEEAQDTLIPVVCGFQGLSPEGRITTLGAGGSDLTAILLAHYLHADRCDIYTDVEGMKTASPRTLPHAGTIDVMSYEELLEMCSMGAKILQTRAARFAMEHHIHLVLRSSLEDPQNPSGQMTSIDPRKTYRSKNPVIGISEKHNDCRITLVDLKNQPGIAANVFALLAEKKINVDMIAQVSPQEGYAHLSFTVEDQDHKTSVALLRKKQKSLNFRTILEDTEIGIVSLVGVGMKDTPGVASKMFRTLAEENINIQVIATSEIKISVLVDAKSVSRAVRVLHKAYFPEENTTEENTNS